MRSRDTTSEVTCMSHETFAACFTRGSVITSACKKTVSGIGHFDSVQAEHEISEWNREHCESIICILG